MTNLAELFPENLYHSYIVEGDPEGMPYEVRSLLEERGDIAINSSELLFQIYDSFSIDDSKKIKEWHSEMSASDSKRICIIGTKFINHDAERTLLKVLEEPHEGTHFFIIVPNADMLLDTILSRAHLVRTSTDDDISKKKSAKEFYDSKPKDRIELVASMIEENKDNVGSGGLRYEATALINDLEKIVYEAFKKNPSDENNKFVLSELLKAREYLSLPGASVKMVLEHISLVL